MTQAMTTLHATTVSVDGKGVLLVGGSGKGKSALALQMIALGARLVADDRTVIRGQDGILSASPPESIAGLIEARGVGLIRLPHDDSVSLVLAVDLDRAEVDRLPHLHEMALLDIALPCLHNVASRHFAPSILLYLRGERIAPA